MAETPGERFGGRWSELGPEELVDRHDDLAITHSGQMLGRAGYTHSEINSRCDNHASLAYLQLDNGLILLTLTKFLAGGTAMMGVMDEMLRKGQVGALLLNQSAGLLISPLDIPGVAVLISAGRRVAGVWRPAALGACVGILVRTLGHAYFF